MEFDKDHPFVEGIFLLKLVTPIHPSLIAMTQGIQNLTEDVKALEFCTPTSGREFENSCAFVFNNGDIFYYTLFFRQVQGSFELVIKSYQRCVYFFLNFLKDIFSSFCDVQSAYDPINVFNLSISLISSWPIKLENEMDIVYSKFLLTVDFSNADFSYNHYRPSYFLQPKMYLNIFNHLISMKPILIVAPDSIVGCKACFSTFCLLYPLRYFEPMILWLRKDDPRYSEIQKSDTKSPYLVVATDDPTDIQSKFDLVIECNQMNRLNTKADTDFQNFAKNVFLLLQMEFTNLLNKNPYSDILNIPWAGQNMENIIKKQKFSSIPPIELMRQFEKSKTIENWRLRRTTIQKFRGYLLQCVDVKFDQLTIQQIEKIHKFLLSVKDEFEDDIHLKAVIKKHLTIVTGILNSNKNE